MWSWTDEDDTHIHRGVPLTRSWVIIPMVVVALLLMWWGAS